MTHRFIRPLGTGLATIAAALGASLVAPAHADVAGNGMTLPGNTFQVGQTVHFSVKPTTSTTSTDYAVMDASGGVTTNDYARFSPDATGTVNLTWTPAFSGTHQVYLVQKTEVLPDGSGIPNPPSAAVFGPVTVQVTGTPSAPTVCEAKEACLTLHGTPQVGCPLTLDFIGYPDTIVAGWKAANSTFHGLGSGSAQPAYGPAHWPNGSTQNEIEFFDSNKMIGPDVWTDAATASVQWAPTTSGFHRIEGAIFLPPLVQPPSPGSTISAGTGQMWVPVAATGTNPCVS
ncbi:hypothetical protein ACFXO9_30700 [Nocardia tengchongensis]|uniref:hypothetical protein n=1 Tax=Nocardia tengchongensis TaxID=2055889 RepID=UPI0036811871